MSRNPLWRPCLTVGLCLSVAVLAGCRENSLPTDDTAPVALAGADASAAVQQDLAAVAAAMAPFHNFDLAAAAGYDTQLTPCWYYSGQGAMGYHYGKLDLIDDTAELLHPEILVYEPGREGKLRLVAMEYIVPIAAWQGGSPPSLFGQDFHRNDALGLYALHLWLWQYNPSGIFADWNPRVSCDNAADSEDRAP